MPHESWLRARHCINPTPLDQRRRLLLTLQLQVLLNGTSHAMVDTSQLMPHALSLADAPDPAPLKQCSRLLLGLQLWLIPDGEPRASGKNSLQLPAPAHRPLRRVRSNHPIY